VPSEPGFKAVFKRPLPEGEVLIYLLGNGGMAVSEAKSLLGGNCGLQPEKLILETPQGIILHSHEMIHRDQTIIVTMTGGKTSGRLASMTAGVIQAKVPSEGVGCLAGCAQNMHWKSLLFTMAIWGSGITALILGITTYDDGTSFILLIVAGCFYLGYLIEAALTSTQKYLCNIEEKNGVHRFVDRLQHTAPQIIWRIHCYHMETRTRWTSYTDANGNRHNRLETYTVRVDTHSARGHYQYDSWDDVSGKLPSLEDYKLTKLTIGKSWMFADAFTEVDYSNRKSWFIAYNDRDVSYDFSTSLSIPGHREKILAEVVPGATPCCLNNGWYWLMNILGLSVCFRWYFTSVSGRRDFNLIKRVQKAVPIMQTWILPMMTVLVPFQVNPIPQQPGMVYTPAQQATQVNVHVSGAHGASVNVNVR